MSLIGVEIPEKNIRTTEIQLGYVCKLGKITQEWTHDISLVDEFIISETSTGRRYSEG